MEEAGKSKTLSSGGNSPMAYNIQTDPMHPVYFKHLYQYAKNISKDPSTQNAALLTNDTSAIICMESNNIPNSIQVKDEYWERPLKYSYVEHAERNVLYKAIRLGIKTEGLTMYCPWFACPDCSRAIIQCGIKRVIGHKQYFDVTPDRWKESVSIGIEMLKESGVECIVWSGVVGGKTNILVNGDNFQP